MTALTSYRPRTGLDLLRHDPFFNRLFGDWGDDLDTNSRGWTPALDLIEHEDSFEVRLDVPGIDPKDIEVTLQNDLLIMRGERKTTHEEKDAQGKIHRRETWEGRFERSVRLPSGVNAGKVKAHGKDGVLEIMLPKAQEAIGRRIAIES